MKNQTNIDRNTIENVELNWHGAKVAGDRKEKHENLHHGNGCGTNGIRVDQIKRTSAWPISCDVAIE